ncbi:hypothetical protein [Paracoccus sp. DMF]|uniref:hypothetical protein n=1 Tax=Paracoccus sp. DMF TaxID=400837 RepID=UPI0021E3E09F|nr:hypothetical protein [Paracoccus sp. DMF]MCV2447477.1 hypothetical protein [Paracoccus sp. DMF]
MTASLPRKTPERRRAHGRITSFFFWATIVGLLLATVGLMVVGALRQPVGADKPASVETAKVENLRQQKTRAEKALEKLPREGRDWVEDKLDDELDRTYQPAFDAIHGYADFHYSILGEYTELLGTALDRSETELDKRVFAGLDGRLQAVAKETEIAFIEKYIEEMSLALDELSASEKETLPADLLETIKGDLMQRVTVTAPVASAASTMAVLGTTKLLSKTVAKKLGAKIAQKAAAKGATKLGGVLTGAGSGAAACAWSGPAAAACGVGGAVIAWVAVDAAVIRLDEYFNRDDFEADLRKQIADHKAATREAIIQALGIKAEEMEKSGRHAVNKHFTARAVKEGGSAEQCRLADEVLGRYHAMRENLSLRRLEAINALLVQLEALNEVPAMAKIAPAMRSALNDKFPRLDLTHVMIVGNLPVQLRADRDVSGRVTINGRTSTLDRYEASKTGGFRLTVPMPASGLDISKDLTVKLELEQHRRLLANRHFDGSLTMPVDELLASLPEGSGQLHQVEKELHLVHQNDGEDGAARGALRLDLTLSAPPLPEMPPLDCPTP